jgi:hypothetical protein
MLQALKDHTVRLFNLSIAPRVWDRGVIDIDPCIVAEVSKLPRYKLSPIVSNYIVEDTEMVHDLW